MWTSAWQGEHWTPEARAWHPASGGAFATWASPRAAFAEVVDRIEQARRRAYQAVNTELVDLYWQIGRYISGKLAAAEWGDGVVDGLAKHLACVMPGQRGFTRRNLFRMRQFYEAYQGDEKVTSLLTQLPWTHNLPDRQLLAAKLHAFYALSAPGVGAPNPQPKQRSRRS